MPKSDVVFRPASDDDDDTEDEIEIIPYTKPAPVVIDLLESDSDDGNSQESRKKSKKKSKKKKSKKRESERGTENSTLCSTSHDTSVTSVSFVNVDSESQPIECLSDNSGVEDIASVQIVEPTTSAEVENGSRNVDTQCNSSSTSVSVETPTPTLCQVNLLEAGPSSLFEKCHDAQSTTKVVTGKTTGIGMVGVGATAASLTKNDNDKRRKSKEKKAKGEGRSRVRTLSATQRTNEEIVSFLTTLGIQMETSAFDTPPTRRRQPRKRQSEPLPPPTDDIEGNSRDSLATNSSDGSSFPRPVLAKDKNDATCSSSTSFVSVTQESNSPSKLEQGTPKGRRQRQAVSGNILDYTVSFTKEDLNAIATNIQSNVLIPPIVNSLNTADQSFIAVQSSDKASKNSYISSTNKVLKPSYYAEVIDAVAKGLESSLLSSTLRSEASIAATSFKDDAIKTAEETTGKRLDEVEVVASEINKGIGEHNHFEEVGNAKLKEQTSAIEIEKHPHPSSSATKESPKNCSRDKVSPIKITEGRAHQETEVECITILEPDVVASKIFKQLDNIAGNSRRNAASNATESNIESTSSSNAVNIANDKHTNNTARKEDSNYKRKRESSTSDAAKHSELTEKSRRTDKNSPSSYFDGKRHKGDYNEETRQTNTTSGDKEVSVDCQIVNQATKENTPEPYFPCTWTEHMKDFYGSNHNENFELDKVMHSLPDCAKAEEILRSKRHDQTRRSSSANLDKHVYKKTSDMFCSNCGRNGHSYYDCNASKFNTYPRNKPFVIRDIKIGERSQSSKQPENVTLGRTKSITDIQISYDSRTGRTVVLNAESDDQPELAVETIQIKITNDLAFRTTGQVPTVQADDESHGGSESISISTSRSSDSIQIPVIAVGEKPPVKLSAELGFEYLACSHEGCSNRLPSDENCYQNMICAQAHLRLLEAQHQGILKPLEEKHQVQICVINDHSLMVHITGSNALDAEIDLYKLLEGTLQRNQISSNNVVRKKSSIPNSIANLTSATDKILVQKNPISTDAFTVTDNTITLTESDPIVVVDEDDDITCIEVSVRELSRNDSPPKIANSSVNIRPDSSPTFYLDESPSAVEVIDSTRPENNKADDGTSDDDSTQTTGRNEDSVSSWKNYESPLTGLCLATNPPENAGARKKKSNNPISRDKELGTRNECDTLVNKADLTSNDPNENVIEVQVKRCYDIIQEVETLDPLPDSTESIDHLAQRSTSSDVDQSQDSRDDSSTQPDLDLIIIDPPTNAATYEVITIDDDDEPVTKRQKTDDNENEVSVTLLPSEWSLVVTESMKKGSVLDRISNSYDAVFEVSKELSSIIIREGNKRSRKLAKEAIVYWLESQCLNTGTRKEHEQVTVNGTGTPKPGPSRPKKRVLNLNDAHQCNPPGERAKQKKPKWKRKLKGPKIRKSKNSSNEQGVSPTGSSSNSSSGTPTKKNKLKKNNASSSLFNSRSPIMHSPSPKKMRRRPKTPNKNPDSSTPSANPNKRVRYFQNQND